MSKQTITDKLDAEQLREIGLRKVQGIVRGMLTRMNDNGAGIINFNGRTYICGDCTRRYLKLKEQLLGLGLWNSEFDKHYALAVERRLNRGEMYKVTLGGFA